MHAGSSRHSSVPRFSELAELEGQINPPGEGQTIAPGQWLRDPSSGGSSAIVQTAVVASGAQAVRVDRAANNDVRWGVPVDGSPTGDFISIVWDMRVDQTSGPSGTFGPYFAVVAFDDTASGIGQLSSLGVDASIGQVLFQAENTGFLTETGDVVGFGTWHRYQLRLDYSTKTYSYFLDGAQLGTEGFVDESNVAGGLNGFSDADITAVAAAGDAASMALTGTAYFDNFLVVEGVFIPMLAGDYNDDGSVDAADYVVWRRNLGTMNSLPNDPNGGTIDERQFATWKTNFGQISANGSDGSIPRPVPEPSTALLILLGAATPLARRRRHSYPRLAA